MRGTFLLTLCIALNSGCFSEEPDAAEPGGGDVTISMTQQLTFAPASMRVPAGTTVEWVNNSSMPHTVTADPARAQNAASVSLPAGASPFHSGLINTGGSFVHEFTVRGTYRYFCQPHEGAGMIATIVVE